MRCPSCNAPMVERERRADGHKFLGCSAFPECRRTVSMEAVSALLGASIVRRGLVAIADSFDDDEPDGGEMTARRAMQGMWEARYGTSWYDTRHGGPGILCDPLDITEEEWLGYTPGDQ